jgi:outer membrane lipoprotein-sorting protein
MNHRFEDELSSSLKDRVNSMNTATDDAAVKTATDAAQARLLARLQNAQKQPRTPSRAASRGGWAVAASVMIALAVGIAVPMLSGNSDAFAAVQAHFRDFKTLSMTITQRFGDRATQTTHVAVDARGVMRTDVGDQLSVIVDAPRGRVMTLLHEPRQAMIAAIPKATSGQQAALSWLDELRAFKGEARRLKETRIIDGRTAHGWRLKLPGGIMTLWADDNDLPLAMQQTGGGELTIDYRFVFDQPIPAGYLSSDPPAGYTPVKPDED